MIDERTWLRATIAVGAFMNVRIASRTSRRAPDLQAGASIWGHDGRCGAFMYLWPEQGFAFTCTLNQAENDLFPLIEAAALRIAAGDASGP